MKEKWVEIYNNLYAVSNLGNVKSNKRTINTKTGIKQYQEKILKPEITNDGHLRVVLCNAGEKKRVLMHRLVAEAFIPNPNDFPVINHKDENPLNNCVDNLEWCTVAYNNAYNNRHQKIGDAEGHDVYVFDKNNSLIEKLPSITEAARKYNISNTTMWRRVQDEKIINNHYFKLHL